ncbi:hypothetical protein Pfo_020764 [Paulownia fortunei]|nr:hypothetical protein Pfo_020764 [Paulownia fortunei]
MKLSCRTSALMATNIVEQCQVAPSSGAATEQLLPLLHFDTVWLPFHPLENLFFYSFQCSESHFLDTIVPNLKNSLSLTLKHFPPLAGNIIFPLTSGMPVSHYVAGDSISLTIALSNADFIHLTGNLSRDADEFHYFVPQLPPAAYLVSICIGFTNHHAIADGATLLGFVQAWASINKFNGDEHLIALGEKYLPMVSSTISLPTYKVRGTFVLSEAEIQKLKNFVLNKKPAIARVSSFMVVCAHVWTCLAKSGAAAGEEVADDEPEYLTCPADCRARLNPPLPDTYFGNCLALVLAESTHGKLKGNEGFVAAAQATGEAIQKIVNNGREILHGSENRLLESRKLNGKRVLGVAGSPRFDLYGTDYGWGRPKKFEAVHIDCIGSVSLCKSREYGGVEIGLSMPKVKMDAFAAIFNQGLSEATENLYA